MEQWTWTSGASSVQPCGSWGGGRSRTWRRLWPARGSVPPGSRSSSKRTRRTSTGEVQRCTCLVRTGDAGMNGKKQALWISVSQLLSAGREATLEKDSRGENAGKVAAASTVFHSQKPLFYEIISTRGKLSVSSLVTGRHRELFPCLFKVFS